MKKVMEVVFWIVMFPWNSLQAIVEQIVVGRQSKWHIYALESPLWRVPFFMLGAPVGLYALLNPDMLGIAPLTQMVLALTGGGFLYLVYQHNYMEGYQDLGFNIMDVFAWILAFLTTTSWVQILLITFV